MINKIRLKVRRHIHTIELYHEYDSNIQRILDEINQLPLVSDGYRGLHYRYEDLKFTIYTGNNVSHMKIYV